MICAFQCREGYDLAVLLSSGDELALHQRGLLGLLAVPRRLFCFGSLVILDVARCYLWLFSLYINIKIGKNSC